MITQVLTFDHDHNLASVLGEPFRLASGDVLTLTLTGANSAWPSGVTLHLDEYVENGWQSKASWTEDLVETLFTFTPVDGRFYRFRGAVSALLDPGGETITAVITRYLEGVTVIHRDASGNVQMGSCLAAAIPADNAPGCAPGCILIATDGETVSKLYCNIGTAAAANFNLVTVAADE